MKTPSYGPWHAVEMYKEGAERMQRVWSRQAKAIRINVEGKWKSNEITYRNVHVTSFVHSL